MESLIWSLLLPWYMDTSLLEELGLSHAEARVYLALLELGLSKSGKIIGHTHLQSSTVYHVIGSLIEKGLATSVIRGKIRLYQAAPPETILSFLDEKQRRLSRMLPDLKALEKPTERRSAQVFEGFNGLQTAFNDILLTMKPKEEYYFIQIQSSYLRNERIILFLRNFHLKRSEKKIIVNGLYQKGSEDVFQKIHKDIPYSNLRSCKEATPTGVTFYKGKVIFTDLQDYPTAFVIQSSAVYDSYVSFFKEKWRTAKQLQ
ncbi:MAG: hypothetical protein QS99_C0002G0170 [archaeon GW2011_AR4]|nr:MAG: hypothetical protein QS99_C0002G0170 [archaeon GW2011_AR4]